MIKADNLDRDLFVVVNPTKGALCLGNEIARRFGADTASNRRVHVLDFPHSGFYNKIDFFLDFLRREDLIRQQGEHYYPQKPFRAFLATDRKDGSIMEKEESKDPNYYRYHLPIREIEIKTKEGEVVKKPIYHRDCEFYARCGINYFSDPEQERKSFYGNLKFIPRTITNEDRDAVDKVQKQNEYYYNFNFDGRAADNLRDITKDSVEPLYRGKFIMFIKDEEAWVKTSRLYDPLTATRLFNAIDRFRTDS